MYIRVIPKGRFVVEDVCQTRDALEKGEDIGVSDRGPPHTYVSLDTTTYVPIVWFGQLSNSLSVSTGYLSLLTAKMRPFAFPTPFMRVPVTQLSVAYYRSR